MLSLANSSFNLEPLIKQGLKDFELRGAQLKIYGQQPIQPYLNELLKQNIELIQMNKESDDLEAFFMKMIGGKS